MIRSWIGVLTLLACARPSLSSPRGVSEESFASASLPGKAVYSILLPPGYASGTRSYPVLYFLHDGFGNHNVLARHGVTEELVTAMENGALPEFLLVCPEGDSSWFSNFHDGSKRYEDLIAQDLPREVERRYRVLPGRENRGITGISMGGYGAVKIALRHPEEYGSVSSLSGAVIPIGWDEVAKIFFLARRQLHRVFGNSAADNSLAENDVWRILETRKSWNVPFEVFLLAGTEDKYHLDHVAAQYASFLNRHGIRATARLEPGIHDWPYWSKAFLEIAKWHVARFGARAAEHICRSRIRQSRVVGIRADHDDLVREVPVEQLRILDGLSHSPRHGREIYSRQTDDVETIAGFQFPDEPVGRRILDEDHAQFVNESVSAQVEGRCVDEPAVLDDDLPASGQLQQELDVVELPLSRHDRGRRTFRNDAARDLLEALEDRLGLFGAVAGNRPERAPKVSILDEGQRMELEDVAGVRILERREFCPLVFLGFPDVFAPEPPGAGDPDRLAG